MKHIICWILILHTLHAPIPCPDLDGECRGAPVESLTDWDAWHVLLLGVESPRDIDRGPFRPTRETPDEKPQLSPYGDAAICSNPDSLRQVSLEVTLTSGWLPHNGFVLPFEGMERDRRPPAPPPDPGSATSCERLCRWLI